MILNWFTQPFGKRNRVAQLSIHCTDHPIGTWNTHTFGSTSNQMHRHNTDIQPEHMPLLQTLTLLWALWHLTTADMKSTHCQSAQQYNFSRVTFIPVNIKSQLSLGNFLFHKTYSFWCFHFDCILVGVVLLLVLNHKNHCNDTLVSIKEMIFFCYALADWAT